MIYNAVNRQAINKKVHILNILPKRKGGATDIPIYKGTKILDIRGLDILLHRIYR